jgi:thiol-disulfide isomerase/thioredoxin
MKKILVLFLLFQSHLLSAQVGESVNFFEGNFNDAVAKAKQDNKLLFIDCFTTWCGPCKWMAANVFTNDTVSKFFNSNFICYKLDMEKGEGLEVAKKYSIKNYPTFLWLDGGGKQIHRSVGSAPVASFMKIANHAIEPKGNLAYLDGQYKAGNTRSELLLAYAYALQAAYDMNCQVVADEYFKKLPSDQLTSATNWKMIVEFTPNINSYIYNTISKSPQPFYDRYGKDSVQHTMDELALKSIQFAAQQKDSVMLENAMSRVKQSSNAEVLSSGAQQELDYYKRNKNTEKYTALASDYVQKYLWTNANALNAVCWTYFMQVNDKTKLKDAEGWIAQSVKLDDKYYNTDTYANILHKMGRDKEAIMMAKHSIEMAKKSGEDFSSTQELLNSMEKKGSAVR